PERNAVAIFLLIADPSIDRLLPVRGTSGHPRHPRLSRYRCSLPGLAGFAGPRCTEPEVPRSGSRALRASAFVSLTQDRAPPAARKPFLRRRLPRKCRPGNLSKLQRQLLRIAVLYVSDGVPPHPPCFARSKREVRAPAECPARRDHPTLRGNALHATCRQEEPHESCVFACVGRRVVCRAPSGPAGNADSSAASYLHQLRVRKGRRSFSCRRDRTGFSRQ